MWHRCFLALALSLVLNGCAFLQYYPQSYIPDKVSDSGIALYNKVGLPISDSGWKIIFGYVDQSYFDLIVCVSEDIDPHVAEKIRTIPIVLIPGRPLFSFGKEIGAFTTLDYIFIRRDLISHRSLLLQERVHIYLYYTEKRFLGDFFHRDSLFDKCKDSVVNRK